MGAYPIEAVLFLVSGVEHRRININVLLSRARSVTLHMYLFAALVSHDSPAPSVVMWHGSCAIMEILVYVLHSFIRVTGGTWLGF